MVRLGTLQLNKVNIKFKTFSDQIIYRQAFGYQVYNLQQVTNILIIYTVNIQGVSKKLTQLRHAIVR